MAPALTTSTAFALSLLGLTLHRNHLVSVLLCLEGLMLALFTTMAAMTQDMATPNTTMSPMLLLAMAACEAGTGLALLVSTARTHASDNLKTLNLLAC
uniref:NADH dehydrogenase subunit 4L n=1 Tax=Hemidactylus mandebensis TaxID=1643449 RepID=UPI0021B543DA|nr:NADH dehydrogenase subunit 4L [Hemidactylus mandebensis]UVW80920.1 NADH dehydrogenase subunit 4L [Hemidactylus mandebensis]